MLGLWSPRAQLYLIIAMFALVDNIFLETVSQQVDKVRGFEQSQYDGTVTPTARLE